MAFAASLLSVSRRPFPTAKFRIHHATLQVEHPDAPDPYTLAPPDGVSDSKDACPDVPGIRTTGPKTNGCPSDRDGDGVPDAEDACPDTTGARTSDPRTHGCGPASPGPRRKS